MITVHALVTGGQIGEQMRNDPIEMAQLLMALASDVPDFFTDQVAYELASASRGKVTEMLKDLLAQIEDLE